MQAQSETNVTFAKSLQRLLDERGTTAAGLSKATGLSHVAIGNYLKGRLPMVEGLLKIAGHFGVTLEEVLGGMKTTPTSRQGSRHRGPDLTGTTNALLRAASEAEASVARLQIAVGRFREALSSTERNEGNSAGIRPSRPALHAASKIPALSGVSSTVASAAESGAVSALAEARRRVPVLSRSPATGAPTVRKPRPARGAARGSK